MNTDSLTRANISSYFRIYLHVICWYLVEAVTSCVKPNYHPYRPKGSSLLQVIRGIKEKALVVVAVKGMEEAAGSGLFGIKSEKLTE